MALLPKAYAEITPEPTTANGEPAAVDHRHAWAWGPMSLSEIQTATAAATATTAPAATGAARGAAAGEATTANHRIAGNIG